MFKQLVISVDKNRTSNPHTDQIRNVQVQLKFMAMAPNTIVDSCKNNVWMIVCTFTVKTPVFIESL